MQILYLEKKLMITLFFVLWLVFQFAAAFICNTLKDVNFQHDRFPYSPFGWEDRGKIYERIFKVHKWKKFLPDGASVWKGGFRKKRLKSFSKSNLERYLVESCRAEFTHWLAITPFWTFGLFAPAKVVGYMLLYALAVNIPCIVAQRYNRPRIARILEKMDKSYTDPNE